MREYTRQRAQRRRGLSHPHLNGPGAVPDAPLVAGHEGGVPESVQQEQQDLAAPGRRKPGLGEQVQQPATVVTAAAAACLVVILILILIVVLRLIYAEAGERGVQQARGGGARRRPLRGRAGAQLRR